MKKIIYALVAILMLTTGARASLQNTPLSVGNSGLSIASGTVLSVQGLVITPSADLTITNNSLTLSGTDITIGNEQSINRVYSFTSPLSSFSGEIGIQYNMGELNGNTESTLQLAYNPLSSGGSFVVMSCSNTGNAESYYVSNTLNSTDLGVLTAISRISPSISNQSTTAQTVCVDGTFSPITVTAVGDGLSYQWYSNANSSNSGGTSLGTNNGADTYSYTPQVTTNGTLYYYCVVTDNCGADTSAISEAFIVNPLPTATISGTTSICKDDSAPDITFSGADGTAPYTFTYKIDSGSDLTVTTTTGNSVTVSAPTQVAGTFTYTLLGVEDANCSQLQTGSAVITVNPEPQAEIVINGTPVGWNYAEEFCYDQIMSVDLGQVMVSGAYPLQSITWVTTFNGNPAPSLSGTETNVGAGFDFNFADNTLPAGEYVISITEMTDANGCNPSSYAPYSATITINPEPQAEIVINGTSVGWNYAEEFCYDQTMSVDLGQAMVSGAYPLQSITWETSINGNPAPSLSGTDTNVGAGFDFNFADNTLPAGEYVISITEMTDANGCNPSSYAPYSATITINPEPQAEIVINGTSVGWNYAEEFCYDQTMSVDLGQAMISGAYPLQSITWLTTFNGNPAPSLSGTETNVGAGFDFNFADNTLPIGEYVISITEMTDGNGCNPASYSPYTATITINPNPTAHIESNDPVCLGNEIELSGVYDEVFCTENCEAPATYCDSYSSIGDYQFISKFKLNSTQNLSGEGTYSDYTQSSFKTLYLDSTYNVSITISGPYNYPHYNMVYADWNRDGDFDDVGESYEIGYLSGVGDVINTITVPANAVLGQTILRVINRKNSYAPACGNYPVGETEDYLIDVKTVDINSITDYEWSGPSGLHAGKYWTIGTSTENDGGTYNLTVTNVFGCSTSTSHVVIVSNPQIDFSQVDTDQEAPFTVQLIPGQFDSYSWSDGSTANSLEVSQYGTYSVTVTEYDCMDSESITLNEVQHISLPQGWEMFSTYINQTADIADVTAAFTNSILLIKNNSGQTYWPAMNINSIHNMIVGQGYQVKMINSEELTVEGISVEPENTPINLNAGVNMIGVLRHTPISAVDLFAPVLQNLILVKLNNGTVYLPQYGVNQGVNLYPDYAFKVIMGAADVLIYPANASNLPTKEYSLPTELKYYTAPVNTGSNMTLVLPLSVINNWVESGDEIAVISDNGAIVGAGVFENQTLAIAVWGNDETKSDKSVFGKDNTFHLEIYHAKSNRITTIDKLEWETGSEFYVENSLAVAKAITSQQNLEVVLFPNPVQDELSVLLTGIKSAQVPIYIYDAVGRLVLEHTATIVEKGQNTALLNTSKLSSGNYYIEVIDNEGSLKVHFIKQ